MLRALFPNTWRLWTHIPVGFLIIGLASIGASLGGDLLLALLTICFIFSYGFLEYEKTQGSQPHIDIASFLWGLFFGAVPWVSLALAGVV